MKCLASVCVGGLAEAPAPLSGPVPPAAARAPCVAPVAVDPFACRTSGFVSRDLLCECITRCKGAVSAVKVARQQVQDRVGSFARLYSYDISSWQLVCCTEYMLLPAS